MSLASHISEPTAQELAASLGGRRNGRGWKCRCPAHNDRNPSLEIDDKNGRTVFVCRAGCDQQSVMDALRRDGHWPEKTATNGVDMSGWNEMIKPKIIPAEERFSQLKGKPVATYDYRDVDGTLLYQVERFEPKRFLQKQPDGTYKRGDRVVMYRWPDLAKFSDATVFITEGEKDADRVASLGHCATTISGGGKWSADLDPDTKGVLAPECIATFAGRDVIVLQDADEEGIRKAAAAAEAVYDQARSVRVVRLPDLPEKGDVSDWLDADPANAERLVETCFAAPQWMPRVPLRLTDWLDRSLPKPDFALGDLLSTTTRGIFWAPTGLGKTLFSMSMALAMSAGADFLGWKGRRPVRVLYIDGEMSRILMQERLRDEVARSGLRPEGLNILSHEDIANFQPLNTKEGQMQIERELRKSGAEFIFADNIMSLIGGEMKDEEPWRLTLAWILSLTRRRIGQLWVHHTGHDTSHGYGTSTREWQMTLVAGMTVVDREDTDVSFKLSFTKARERKPSNRPEFAERNIALVNDRWVATPAGKPPGHIAPLTLKFYEAFCAAIADEKMYGCPAASIKDWQAQCIKMGLLDKAEGKSVLADNSRAMFSKERRLLIAANRIVCNDTMAWLVADEG